MKTIHIEKPNEISLIEKPIPIPLENEALLKIKYAGICGADIATYTGNQPFTTYPRIPGHEFSAEIVSIGKNSLGLEIGDIVTANPYFNCGKCYSCKRGLVNACTSNQTMGVQRDGAFSEYITIPIERIYKNNSLSPKTLALVEPFSISYHAVNRCNIKKGDKILILGAGAIGIFALISAKLKGAEVYIADTMDFRLQKSLENGANGVINITSQNLMLECEKITNGNGFDVCIEAVGSNDTFLNTIELAAFGANIILIGNGKKEVTFNHSIILKKELNIFGSRNSLKQDFLDVINLLTTKNFNIENLISNIYKKEDSLTAFKELANNDGTKMKALIEF